MYVVVNHLHFRDVVTDATVRATQDAVRQVVDAGALAARVVRVEDRWPGPRPRVDTRLG